MSMGMMMSHSLGQTMLRESCSCLTKLEELIQADGGEGLRIFSKVESRRKYRSGGDYMVAIYVPQLRLHIREFYKDRGPCMIDQFKPAFIKKVDDHLTMAYAQAHRVFSLMKDEADRMGVSRTEILEEIRISVAAQTVPRMDLEPHYLVPGGGLKRLTAR
jgi:hypothetical protein